MNNFQTYKKLFGYCHELRSTLAAKMDVEERSDLSMKIVFSAFAIAKGYKTFGSVLILTKKGYGEDAFVASRSLWELMITYLYIMDDLTNYRITRYLDYDWVQRKKMYTQYISKNPNLDKQDEESVRIREEVIKKGEEMQSKYNFDLNSWSDKNILEMSNEVGKESQYHVIYRLQCSLSHNNPRSMNEYMINDPEKAILNFGESDRWVLHAVSAAFDSLISIAYKASEIFEWDIQEKLKILEDKFDTEFKTFTP